VVREWGNQRALSLGRSGWRRKPSSLFCREDETLSRSWHKSVLIISNDNLLVQALQEVLSEDDVECCTIPTFTHLSERAGSPDLTIVDARHLCLVGVEGAIADIRKVSDEAIVIVQKRIDLDITGALLQFGATDVIGWPAAKRLLYHKIIIRLQESISSQLKAGRRKFRQDVGAAKVTTSPKPTGGRRITVAVVEDETDIRLGVMRALRAEGFYVRTFVDGYTAARALAYFPIDIVIIDIMMPKLDGMELLRRLRQKVDVPAIFLTAKDEEIDELFGLKMGADDYIIKPFSMRLLVLRLKAVLRRCGYKL